MKKLLGAKPDLVLLDLHLPDARGIDVLKQLRSNPKTSSIPVVVLSADATAPQMERLLADGAATYITKPIRVRTFLHALDEILTTTTRPNPDLAGIGQPKR